MTQITDTVVSGAAALAGAGLHTPGSIGLAIVFFAMFAGAVLFLLSADGRLMATRWPWKAWTHNVAHDVVHAQNPEQPEGSLCEADGPAGDEADPVLEDPELDLRCKMDLAATQYGLELTVDLPGVEEKDIDIEVADELLTIRGELKVDPDREAKNYRLTERSFGAFARSIELPKGVMADRIRANLNRGVLTVAIPNPCKAQPKKIEVQAKPVHVAETTDGLSLVVEMPGLGEDDVDVVVSGRQLCVRTGCGRAAQGPEGCQTADEGRLSRSIELPVGVNADRISAALSNGVLTVTIPHAATPEARKIKVRADAPEEKRLALARVGGV